MTYTRINIDGDVVFEGELGERTQRTPAQLAKLVTPTGLRTPGMIAVATAFGDAVKLGARNVDIVLTHRLNGYDLNVTQN